MGAVLPDLSREEFSRRLTACSPEALSAETVARLFAHFLELRRWNPTLSLVGPGTAEDLVERHYGDSLAALPLLCPRARRLVDLGSGAGFPGLVLAAARPELEVTLVEARQRKWAFLMSACRKASLSCRCLNARFGAAPPPEFPEEYDLVSCRGVDLSVGELEALGGRLAPGGGVLLWRGAGVEPLPAGWQTEGEMPSPGGAHLRVLRVSPGAVAAQ